MNVTYVYRSPMEYDNFNDACENVTSVGINVTDMVYAILRGIHHCQPIYFQEAWVAESVYDFPFEGDPSSDIGHDEWCSYLTHYYTIMRKSITNFVIPLPHPPSTILIAEISHDKLVVKYVP